ncbi:toxin-antitoxin system YwqK family antitoxin [Bacteroidota bacterium]
MKHMRTYLVFILSYIGITLSAQNAFDSEGRRTGSWKGYWEDSTLRYEVTFHEGRPVGTEKRYDTYGNLTAEMHYYGISNRCMTKIFSPSGQVQAKGVYEDRIKDSTWHMYAQDGTIRVIENYKRGLLHGTTTTFHLNGNISSTKDYSDSIFHGKWMKYYPNGDTMLVAGYQNGKMHGRYLAYYPDQVKQISGRYSNDVKDGEWVYFSNEGDTISVLEYENGMMLNPEEYENLMDSLLKSIDSIIKYTPPSSEPEF